MMNILLLSFYYPPDLSAGSFRASAMAEALSGKLDSAGGSVIVVCAMPNRYRGYEVVAPEREEHGNLKIIRVPVPVHANGMADQAKSYARYAWQVLSRTRSMDVDVVIGTSSRLMTAMLAVIVARRIGAALYLDIRDIFSETIGDVLGGVKGKFARLVFEKMERFVYRRAERLNVVSQGFVPYVTSHIPFSKVAVFTNGIDDLFVNAARSTAAPVVRNPKRIVYAGNIGDGQGLELVIPQAAARLHDDWEFVVVGDGGTRDVLIESVRQTGARNVQIHPPVRRDKLLKTYREADVLFLHLNKKAAFERVLPSKIFEYAAMGKPVLAGVSGHAADFLKDHVDNSAVFEPGDVDGMIRALRSLKLKDMERREFVTHYSRAKIMDQMADDVITVAGNRRRSY